MSKVQIFQVDAFSEVLFAGNPAGVVLNADSLSSEQMQMIARELNNSETAFVLPPQASDHDVHLRFFTPTTEVPVCGHATIAAHYTRAVVHGFGSCTTVQKTGAGLGSVVIEEASRKGSYRVTMVQNKPTFSAAIDGEVRDDLLIALGVRLEEVQECCPIQVVSTGHSKVLIGLKDAQILDRLVPDLDALTSLSRRIGSNGYFAFVLHRNGENHMSVNNSTAKPYSEGRMFAPAIGIPEDPVTGNANGPLGAYIVRHNLLQHDGCSLGFRARQGRHVGRPGQMDVLVSIDDGAPADVRVTGTARIVFQAVIDL